MTGPITTYRRDTSVIMDGSTVGGVFIEVLNMAFGSSGSKSYPRTVGGSLFVYGLAAGNHTITIDTDQVGQGRVNWASGPGWNTDSVIAVFARRLISPGRPGMTAFNSAGDVIIDSQYPVPQFLGKLQMVADPYANPRLLSSGYVAYSYIAEAPGIAALGYTTNRVAMIAMPDSGTADVWYEIKYGYIAAGDNNQSVEMVVYAPPGVSFEVPAAYIYSFDKPTNPAGANGLVVRDLTSQVVYNSASENLSVRSFINVTAPAIGATNTYAANFSSTSGIVLPSFRKAVPAANGQGTDVYTQAFKRVGQQITNKLILSGGSAGVVASYELGVKNGAFCPIVDLGALGYATVTVTNVPPTITSNPSNTGTLAEGAIASFAVGASGSAPLSYQWRKNGANIAGATASTYAFTVGASDTTGDAYSCVVSNASGSATSTAAMVTVTHPGGGTGPTPPTITSNPSDTGTLSEGSMASFAVGAAGTAPLSYQWRKNGSNIPGATSSTYSFIVGASDYTGDGYSCRVSNSAGFATSLSATITVTHPGGGGPVSPTIANQPSAQSVTRGAGAFFSVTASPTTAYQWYRNGVSVSGATSSGYSADTSTAGSFSIFVRCFNGTAAPTDSSVVTLTVSAPVDSAPVISTQPVNTSTTIGVAVSMRCVASPVTGYQWRVNNSNIPGATGSTFSPDVSAPGSFGIDCVVTNGTAQTVSSYVALVVATATTTYGSYRDLDYREDIVEDAAASVAVTGDEGWGVGSGDSGLYDIRASGTGDTGRISGGTQQLNTWYPFSTYPFAVWTLLRPNSPLLGHQTTCTLSISIRLRSSGAVVSSGTAYLQSTNT